MGFANEKASEPKTRRPYLSDYWFKDLLCVRIEKFIPTRLLGKVEGRTII